MDQNQDSWRSRFMCFCIHQHYFALLMVNYDEWMESNMNMWDDSQMFTHGLEPVFPLGWMNTNVGVRLDVSFRSWRKKRIKTLYVTSISCMSNTHVIAYINIHMHAKTWYNYHALTTNSNVVNATHSARWLSAQSTVS